ncbi:hypothetical protein GF352_03995 [archaeon]|nr:hypothetical protein [archaeon]
MFKKRLYESIHELLKEHESRFSGRLEGLFNDCLRYSRQLKNICWLENTNPVDFAKKSLKQFPELKKSLKNVLKGTGRNLYTSIVLELFLYSIKDQPIPAEYLSEPVNKLVNKIKTSL